MNEAHTSQVNPADAFKMVGPVQKLVVECPCGCGALTDAPFKGHLWVAVKDEHLFFGAVGPHAWLLRMLTKWRPIDQGGRVRIVVMNRGRLLLAEPCRLFKMSPPPEGTRSIVQDEIGAVAGKFLCEPPPGVSVVNYFGPLVGSIPPRVPKIQLLWLAASRWTLAD